MSQALTAAEVEKKVVGGETIAAVFGITDDQIKSLMAVGLNQYQQGKLDKAETLFRGVAAVNSKSYLGFAGLGAVAMAKKPADLNTALSCLTRAVELQPEDADLRANLGEVLLRLGKVIEAKPHLEKAFALDPNRKDAGVNRIRGIVAGLNVVVQEAVRRQQAKAS